MELLLAAEAYLTGRASCGGVAPIQAVGEIVSPLFRQRHNIALQPRGFLGQLQMEVDLVQVGAHPQQNAARRGVAGANSTS